MPTPRPTIVAMTGANWSTDIMFINRLTIAAPTPRIWIQPAITGVKQDGRFTGMVYLGTEREGAGEKFNIFVLADKNKERFREGQILPGLPKDCVASDPVTVLRTR